MNKILVIGANGMLGGSLFRYFSAESNHEVLGTVRSSDAQSVIEQQGFKNTVCGIDVSDQNCLDRVITEFQPNYVFNCVGVIKQLDASKLPVSSIEINSLLPHQLAVFCDRIGAKLIHFSTDCVFSGSKGNYLESDVPDAFDLYGRSKLLGEVDYGNHLTLRTSIIGHELGKSLSLIDWFLSQTDEVNGYSRAVFSGLPTVCVAEFLDRYVVGKSSPSELMHLSVEPIDKFALLKLVGQVYGVTTKINEFSDFEIDRSLNSSKLRKSVGFKPDSWANMIEKMHNEYQQYFN